jgi:hypothetical protein
MKKFFASVVCSLALFSNIFSIAGVCFVLEQGWEVNHIFIPLLLTTYGASYDREMVEYEIENPEFKSFLENSGEGWNFFSIAPGKSVNVEIHTMKRSTTSPFSEFKEHIIKNRFFPFGDTFRFFSNFDRGDLYTPELQELFDRRKVCSLKFGNDVGLFSSGKEILLFKNVTVNGENVNVHMSVGWPFSFEFFNDPEFFGVPLPKFALLTDGTNLVLAIEKGPRPLGEFIECNITFLPVDGGKEGIKRLAEGLDHSIFFPNLSPPS